MYKDYQQSDFKLSTQYLEDTTKNKEYDQSNDRLPDYDHAVVCM